MAGLRSQLHARKSLVATLLGALQASAAEVVGVAVAAAVAAATVAAAAASGQLIVERAVLLIVAEEAEISLRVAEKSETATDTGVSEEIDKAVWSDCRVDRRAEGFDQAL